MELSTDRILTTHVGSLPRPDGLADEIIAREKHSLTDARSAALGARITAAVGRVVAHQSEAGLAVINDGEMSKIGYATYAKERLSGFDEDEPMPEGSGLVCADLDDYPGMAERSLDGLETATPVCTGPISYTGEELLKTDVENLAAGLDSSGANPVETFMNAASPGVIALYLPNKHYATMGEYLFAIADAMAAEYEGVVAAGHLLQIDAPDLAMGRHTQYTSLSDEEYLAQHALHVEAINRAVTNIDPARVRVHVCWGNYQGPHHRDIEMKKIVASVLNLKPHGLAFESANHRHAHEWAVMAEATIPEEKVLIPGVIDTSSVYVEHPELIAQRIERFASIVGRERVIAGTDCGFASFASFLAVDESLAWAKLATLAEGAALASERLWK